MASKPDLSFLEILKNISHFFDFLFTRGFHMISIISMDHENWQVALMREDCIIKIFCYQGELDLALGTLQLYNTVGLFALDDLIHCVNGNEDLSDPLEGFLMNEPQNFERLAWRLEKHIDKILCQFRTGGILSLIAPPSTLPHNSGSVFHNN